MCSGPLFGKILIFALPIMSMNILQLLFNAADMVVVGRFSGSEALAAVGATGSLINLIVNFSWACPSARVSSWRKITALTGRMR